MNETASAPLSSSTPRDPRHASWSPAAPSPLVPLLLADEVDETRRHPLAAAAAAAGPRCRRRCKWRSRPCGVRGRRDAAIGRAPGATPAQAWAGPNKGTCIPPGIVATLHYTEPAGEARSQSSRASSNNVCEGCTLSIGTADGGPSDGPGCDARGRTGRCRPSSSQGSNRWHWQEATRAWSRHSATARLDRAQPHSARCSR